MTPSERLILQVYWELYLQSLGSDTATGDIVTTVAERCGVPAERVEEVVYR